MSTLILDVHGDDVPLFSAFTAMRERAYVQVVNPTVPVTEIGRAFLALDLIWLADDDEREFDVVYAPAYHADGHEGHNEVSFGALEEWGRSKVRFYETYAPRGQRTRTETEVPYEPWMVARKLRALSCFESQIEQESTRPWFTYLLDVREWLA
jgi:hypothetical protein